MPCPSVNLTTLATRSSPAWAFRSGSCSPAMPESSSASPGTRPERLRSTLTWTWRVSLTPRPGRGASCILYHAFPDSLVLIIDTQTIETLSRVLYVASCKVRLLSAVVQQFPGVTDVLFLIYSCVILTPFHKRCNSSLWRGLSGVDYIVVFVRALPWSVHEDIKTLSEEHSHHTDNYHSPDCTYLLHVDCRNDFNFQLYWPLNHPIVCDCTGHFWEWILVIKKSNILF